MFSSKPSEIDLWVVMPVYNEDQSIESVVKEWLEALRAHTQNFVFCLINDGSTDNSLHLMQSMAHLNPEVRIIDKNNSGHGQSCLLGYREAVEHGAVSTLQIDSDGQCDPIWLPEFVKCHASADCVFGNRVIRHDGNLRLWVSRLLRWVVQRCTGECVLDSNVPYRLMKTRALEKVLPAIPQGVDLANIFLAIELQRGPGIRWIDIEFRDRSGGRSSTNLSALAQKMSVLIPELRRFRA